MNDGLDLSVTNRATRIRRDDDRGLGVCPISHESALPRQREMHPRVLNGIDPTNTLREFFFDRRVVARLLHELTGAERHRLTEHGGRVARRLLGQTCRRQHDARFVEFGGRNGQRTAARIERDVDAVFLQQLLRGFLVGVGHRGIERSRRRGRHGDVRHHREQQHESDAEVRQR